MTSTSRLIEVLSVFFTLGLTAFGGPAAHIALFERELVNKRKWLRSEEFLDLIGITQLIPGPNSTELAMHCGKVYAGTRGMVVAGFAFITPAFFLTVGLTWMYTLGTKFTAIEPALMGIQAAMIAVILHAGIALSKKGITNWKHAAVAILTMTALAFGATELAAILLAGFLGWVLTVKHRKPGPQSFWPITAATAMLTELRGETLPWIFFQCLKIGSILYGSGYVLIAYMEGSFVGYPFLTMTQLLDAVAIGQLTPGPVLTTASSVGFLLAGFSGALLATLGIFAPSFVFVLLSHKFLTRVKDHPHIKGVMTGLRAGAVSLIAFVCFELARNTVVGWQAALIFALAYGWLLLPNVRFRLPILVAGSALLGWFL